MLLSRRPDAPLPRVRQLEGRRYYLAEDSLLYGIHFTRRGEYHGREYYVEVAYLTRRGKRFTEMMGAIVSDSSGVAPDPTCFLRKWS